MFIRLTAALVVAAAIFSPFAFAEKVIATVNGVEITEEQYQERVAQMPAHMQQQEESLRGRLVRDMVLHEVLYQESERLKLANDDEVKAQLAELRKNVLVRSLVEQMSEDAEQASNKSLQEYYEANQSDFSLPEQIRASHILLKTEDDAAQVVKALKNGADFAELAKSKSTGPSGPSGGDLGMFGRGQMVPAFEQAAFALEEGEVSSPVKTQFGYHVIKLTDRQAGAAQSFEDVKDNVRKQYAASKIERALENLESQADISIEDPSYQMP